MAFNIFDTHTLLASVEQMYPLNSFFLDRYFPTNASRDVFSTADVLVEYKQGNNKAAPFVAPRKGGMTILRDGYNMKSFTPANIAPKRNLTIDDLKKRGFGEALYPTLTPAQREGRIMMDDLDELRIMIARRKEAMAAEVIFTGGCIMHEYTDDLGTYEEKEVRYYDGATNPGVYTPSSMWADTEAGGKQMLDDIAAMIAMLTTRGLPATECIMAPDVASLFLRNEWILKLLDNRNYNIGGIDPSVLTNGVAKIARLNINGRMIDFLIRDDTYTELDGTVKSFVPQGMIAVGAPNAGRTLYGAITQVEQSDGQFHTYTGMNVPKYISDATHNIREVMLSSAPLPMVNNESPFSVARVIAAAD